MELDDIISYHDLVTEEKSALQKGMNYGVGKNYSVFSPARRPLAKTFGVASRLAVAIVRRLVARRRLTSTSLRFGSHVCRAGFLRETARGNFRFGDAIENGA